MLVIPNFIFPDSTFGKLLDLDIFIYQSLLFGVSYSFKYILWDASLKKKVYITGVDFKALERSC